MRSGEHLVWEGTEVGRFVPVTGGGAHRKRPGKHRAWPRRSRLLVPAVLAYAVLSGVLIGLSTAVGTLS